MTTNPDHRFIATHTPDECHWCGAVGCRDHCRTCGDNDGHGRHTPQGE